MLQLGLLATHSARGEVCKDAVQAKPLVLLPLWQRNYLTVGSPTDSCANITAQRVVDYNLTTIWRLNPEVWVRPLHSSILQHPAGADCKHRIYPGWCNSPARP